jgi:hypothetical protein
MAKQNKIAANLQQDYTEAEKAQARQNIGLAEVAHSGDYNDLINRPAQVTGQVQSNWTQTNETAVDFIKNKPTIIDPVNADWNATSGLPKILNKPSIPTKTSDLQNDSGYITAAQIPEQVKSDWLAVSGPSEILNKPSIPTKTSDITNDSGYITLAEVPAQVKSDWEAVSGPAEILHKPTIPDNIFVALYNVTTWAEMEAAWNAGKVIILKGADFGSNIHTQMELYDFNTTSGQTRKFLFAPTVVPRIASYIKYYAVLDESTGWSKDYFSNGAPTVTGGVFQLSGDEVAHDLVSHRGWLSNGIYNFDIKFFCSANACNIYMAYVDQPFTVDIVGTRRNVRNDLKAQIDSTTTVQSLVTSIDVWSRVVLTGQSFNSTSPRIDIATLGPQEISNFNYDIYWDLDIILSRPELTGSTNHGYHLSMEKFGDTVAGHSYLVANLTGSDLF